MKDESVQRKPETFGAGTTYGAVKSYYETPYFFIGVITVLVIHAFVIVPACVGWEYFGLLGVLLAPFVLPAALLTCWSIGFLVVRISGRFLRSCVSEVGDEG